MIFLKGLEINKYCMYDILLESKMSRCDIFVAYPILRPDRIRSLRGASTLGNQLLRSLQLLINLSISSFIVMIHNSLDIIGSLQHVGDLTT